MSYIIRAVHDDEGYMYFHRRVHEHERVEHMWISDVALVYRYSDEESAARDCIGKIWSYPRDDVEIVPEAQAVEDDMLFKVMQEMG